MEWKLWKPRELFNRELRVHGNYLAKKHRVTGIWPTLNDITNSNVETRLLPDFLRCLGFFCTFRTKVRQVKFCHKPSPMTCHKWALHHSIGDGSKPWYLVNPKIAGKWMFIPLKMVLIGIDPYPIDKTKMARTKSRKTLDARHRNLCQAPGLISLRGLVDLCPDTVRCVQSSYEEARNQICSS